jgi:flagellar hook-associated protein 1 FlgK
MPISSFYGLQTTLRGLLAQQRALDVTSHNISNANTEGYSRQEAVLAATPATEVHAGISKVGVAYLGSGVDVMTYRRIRDAFVDLQFRAQNMQLGGYETTSRSLDQVELALLEPGDNGISAQLGKFWSAWADLANSAESQAVRQALVTQAGSVVSSIRQLDAQLQTTSAQATSEYNSITGPTGEVAVIANEIASLNQSIKASVSSGNPPNDLLDRRDALLDRLSNLAQVSTTDLGNGAIRVNVGDAAAPLVDDATITWPQALTAPGGKLGSLLTLTAAPGGTIASYRTDLRNFARQLADTVNTLHNPGGAGTNFFSYVAGNEAATLTVNVTAPGVRAGTAAAPGENDIALAIARLRGGAADTAYSQLVSRIGGESRDATQRAEAARALTDAVADRRDSVAGVSLDEEMTNLVRFQRGYQASARAMSTVDEMLDVLINRTGRVGL